MAKRICLCNGNYVFFEDQTLLVSILYESIGLESDEVLRRARGLWESGATILHTLRGIPEKSWPEFDEVVELARRGYNAPVTDPPTEDEEEDGSGSG